MMRWDMAVLNWVLYFQIKENITIYYTSTLVLIFNPKLSWNQYKHVIFPTTIHQIIAIGKSFVDSNIEMLLLLLFSYQKPLINTFTYRYCTINLPLCCWCICCTQKVCLSFDVSTVQKKSAPHTVFYLLGAAGNIICINNFQQQLWGAIEHPHPPVNWL